MRRCGTEVIRLRGCARGQGRVCGAECGRCAQSARSQPRPEDLSRVRSCPSRSLRMTRPRVRGYPGSLGIRRMRDVPTVEGQFFGRTYGTCNFSGIPCQADFRVCLTCAVRRHTRENLLQRCPYIARRAGAPKPFAQLARGKGRYFPANGQLHRAGAAKSKPRHALEDRKCAECPPGRSD